MKTRRLEFAAALAVIAFASAAYASDARPRPMLDIISGILSSIRAPKSAEASEWTGYQIIKIRKVRKCIDWLST
jgi:hypothetical protein